MRPHLVIGASGLVGQHVLRCVENAGLEGVGTCCTQLVEGLRQLQIEDSQAVRAFTADVEPAVIYLTAGLTNVEYCEVNWQDSYRVNVLGARNVAEAAMAVGARVVYFSTDYVFRGVSGPYSESDPVCPICVYGLHKVFAEHHIALHIAEHLILRTTVVFGPERQGKNFICRLVKTLRSGQSLKVPVDQYGSPTYVCDLASVAVELATSEETGLFHVCGPEVVNRYRFAQDAAAILQLNQDLLVPVRTSELAQKAPRPLKAGMNVDRLRQQTGLSVRSYKEALELLAAQGELWSGR